ncbi:hypothetical protein NXS19_004853 [Fusarium pseudograminearum]|nr:hypothetical protein NXS19_004853 [Fusarium pseudograminearum]
MQHRFDNDFEAVNSTDIPKIFFRPIVAYHFFQRSTFEEIPEKALVKRVQVHLAALKLPMLDIDVAQMLQYAADKVPIHEAVEKQLRDYIKKIKASETVSRIYDR